MKNCLFEVKTKELGCHDERIGVYGSYLDNNTGILYFIVFNYESNQFVSIDSNEFIPIEDEVLNEFVPIEDEVLKCKVFEIRYKHPGYKDEHIKFVEGPENDAKKEVAKLNQKSKYDSYYYVEVKY